MRTTVELPDTLLHQAMRAARGKTKTEVVTLALARAGQKIERNLPEEIQRKD